MAATSVVMISVAVTLFVAVTLLVAVTSVAVTSAVPSGGGEVRCRGEDPVSWRVSGRGEVRCWRRHR